MTTHRVWVSMDVFEGSVDAWGKLRVGDVLRVEAEEYDYKHKGAGKDNCPAAWKATEAVLISTANTDTSKMRKEAKKEAEVQQRLRACICAHACPCPCAQNSFIEHVPFFPFKSCRRWCSQTPKQKYARFCLRICVATGTMSSHVRMQRVEMLRTYSNMFPCCHVSTCARTLRTYEHKLKFLGSIPDGCR